MMKLSSVILIMMIFVFVVSSVSFLFYELLQVQQVYLYSLLAFLAFASLAYALYYMLVMKREVDHMTRGDAYPILYEKITKEVRILNIKGDARIRKSFHARNTSQRFLNQILHEISYDGKMTNLQVVINGKKSEPSCEQFVRRKVVGERSEILPPVVNIMKIKFDFEKERIASRKDFTYEFEIILKSVYSRMMTEDFSAIKIESPTEKFVLSLFAPEGTIFAVSSLNIRVETPHGLVDDAEELRTGRQYRPKVSVDNRSVVWTISRPKLAVKYAFFFKLEKTANG